MKHGLLLSIFAIVFSATIPASASQSVVEADRQRIQRHLERVEAQLRAKDVSHLSPEQRAAREANLDTLHEYRLVGEFPHNTMSREMTPIFIDADGRACAVAHLMIESGWEAQAKAIAEHENFARLPEMRSPEVAAWLPVSGLTAEEATLIQPSYNSCNDGCSCETDVVCGDDGKTYVNECFARNCGDVTAVVPGCCAVDDEIESSSDDGYGALGTICPPPGFMSDAGTSDAGGDAGSQDPGAALCPEAVEPPEPDPDASDNNNPTDSGPKDEPRACQTAHGFGPVSGGWLLCGIALVWGIRRRVSRSGAR